jgi:hypothetical protein
MSFWDGTRWILDRQPSLPGVPRRRIRDWIATVIMVLSVFVLVYPGLPSEASGPSLSASPASARPGQFVRINGRGFVADATLQLTWDGAVNGMPALRATTKGTFSVRFMVGNTTPGTHVVAATQAASATAQAKGSVVVASVDVSVYGVALASGSPSASPTAISTATPDPTVKPTVQPTAVPTAPPTPPPTPRPTPIPTQAPAPPPPPPPSGLPYINPSYGTLFRKVFTDGTFGPFKVLTYPDDHIGGAGQFMTVYNRFSNGAQQASVHDGYLDLRATRRSDGLWNAAFVGTSFQGNGPTFGYGVYRFWLRFNIAPQTWQAAWLYDTTSWSATEIDFPEVLEGDSLTAHVLGSGAGGLYGFPRPATLASSFHEFTIERRPTYVAYSIDGVQVGRINGSMPASKLAILFDSKVGWPWAGAAGAPSASTPSDTYMQVAAVTVDP